MKKLFLALTGLLFIACSAGGGGKAMPGGDNTPAPLPETTAGVCDQAALNTQIASLAPTIPTSSLLATVTYLKEQSAAADCTQEEVISYLANYLASTPIVTICPTSSNCHPSAAYVEGVVQAAIEAAVTSSNSAAVLPSNIKPAGFACSLIPSCVVVGPTGFTAITGHIGPTGHTGTTGFTAYTGVLPSSKIADPGPAPSEVLPAVEEVGK